MQLKFIMQQRFHKACISQTYDRLLCNENIQNVKECSRNVDNGQTGGPPNTAKINGATRSA